MACYHQRMADGRGRERNVLPSIKMPDKDQPEITCIRGLTKEFGSLGLTSTAIAVDASSMMQWEEIVDSPSYQSLTTQYILYQCTVSSRLAVRGALDQQGHTPIAPSGAVAGGRWRSAARGICDVRK